MKRLLLSLAMLMGFLGIYAQEIALSPRKHSKKTANFVEEALLTKHYQFAYIAYPTLTKYGCIGLSFSYDNMTLTLCKQRKPTPEEENNPQIKICHNKYEMKISKEQADALFSLFTSAVYSSSFTSGTSTMFDGCLYEFKAGTNAGVTRSPMEENNCKNLVRIANKLCESVEEQDSAYIDTMLDEIKVLTETFVSYYPFEISEHSVIYAIHKKYKVKGPSVGLKD